MPLQQAHRTVNNGCAAGAHSSSFLCMAGLHGAVLALYALQEDISCGGQWSFQQLCSTHASPLLFCHSWGGGSHVEDVPGSMLLLAGTGSAHSVQVHQSALSCQYSQTANNCSGQASLVVQQIWASAASAHISCPPRLGRGTSLDMASGAAPRCVGVLIFVTSLIM